jgi:subtilisin family serine protease
MWANHALGVPGFASSTNSGCETAAEVAAIRYAADNGAKVINFSIGGPSPQPAILDALNYAVTRGAFVAISGVTTRWMETPSFPASYAAQIDG